MIIFLVILCFAALQDLALRSIGKYFLLLSGAAGLCYSIFAERQLEAVLFSIGVGAALLLLCRVTEGKIGEGDGWFFIISGLYLDARENMLLFILGLLFCSLFCLSFLAVSLTGGKRIRGRKFPFLPFLVPAGLWLSLARIG